VRSEFPHPRDWAAFCYLGDWDRPPVKTLPDIPTYINLQTD
jgi:hypothetical protein